MSAGLEAPPSVEEAGGDGGPRVLLLSASSGVEREVLEGWARGQDGPVETIAVDSGALERRLEGRDDPQLVPVGVAWLPAEHRGRRRARLRDLVTLRDPWHPSEREQRRILRDHPDRCEIVVGDPATVSELRSRNDGDGGLAPFVRRQARLTLERAERAIVGVQYKVPHLVKEEILDSTRFRADAEDLAGRLGEDPAAVLARAETALDEMVASQSRTAIDVWEQFGSYLARAHRIEVDDTRVQQLRELGRHRSLVFLPSHRSYLDPVVLRPALLRHGLPPNHVLGGLNVSFWPIGPITRRSSYVFIRRKIRGDDVYKWTLSRYLGYLVRKRFNLEWYMEGGRSRTGKLLPPKYGLLSWLVDAVRADGSDCWLVPTSITYEQLHEAGEMTEQARGKAKTKEDLPWLFGYARSQGRRIGRVHVRFGEPLALRDALGDAGDPDAAEDDVRLAVQRTGIEVSHRINTATPVTQTALVALALLGSQQRARTRPEVLGDAEALRDHARRRGVLTVGREGADAASALDDLCESGVLECFEGGTEPVYRVAPDQHLLAAFYANSAVHAYLVRAIAEVAEQDEDPAAQALALRDLLKFEFFFATREPFEAEVADELERAPEPLVAHRVLRPIAEAYAVAADVLERAGDDAADADDLATAALGAGRQRLLQGEIGSPDAVSTELFKTAFQLADNRGLLEAGRAAERVAFHRELRDLCARLDALAERAEA